ncbi:MAG: universal stress protein [Gammaproteobacteria bacterium]
MKLLVAVDLSESTEKIITKAEEIAKALSAKIWLLHIAEPEPADLYIAGYEPDSIGLESDPQLLRDAIAKSLHRDHCHLQEIADQLRKTGLDTTALLVQGATVETILEEASKLDVDMIIVGFYGRGSLYKLLIGSVSEGLLHKSEYPILVIPTH